VSPAPRRLLFAAATAACLAGALFYGAKGAGAPVRDLCLLAPDPARVEGAYKDVLADLDAGRRDEALIALSRRAEEGPHPGAARFLLGEIAYAEGAYRPALDHYREAVRLEPTLADRGGPFGAKKTIRDHLAALRAGPWAGRNDPAMRELFALERRLAGGCQ